LRTTAAAVRQELADQRIACEQYAYEHGIDRPDITEWRWPHPTS
jgi:xylulose-5-phosphate/fructose-6-phosphate phosphoketolase